MSSLLMLLTKVRKLLVQFSTTLCHFCIRYFLFCVVFSFRCVMSQHLVAGGWCYGSVFSESQGSQEQSAALRFHWDLRNGCMVPLNTRSKLHNSCTSLVLVGMVRPQATPTRRTRHALQDVSNKVEERERAREKVKEGLSESSSICLLDSAPPLTSTPLAPPPSLPDSSDADCG